MTRQELELKAKEFDSKLKRHPMSSEELQNVLCDFVEALRIHDVVGRSEQLRAFKQFCHENYGIAISHRIIDEFERYGS